MSISVARTAFLLWVRRERKKDVPHNIGWGPLEDIETVGENKPSLVGICRVDCLQFGDQHSHYVYQKEYVQLQKRKAELGKQD